MIQAVWANVAPRAALAPPSPEAKRQLACRAIDLEIRRDAECRRQAAITECFRIDRNGQILDTQYQLVSREDAYATRESRGGYYSVNPNPFGNEQRGYYYYDNNGRYAPGTARFVAAARAEFRARIFGRDPRVQAPPPRDPYGREYQTPQRIDPGYIWGSRRYY